jgi:hypothetical protein
MQNFRYKFSAVRNQQLANPDKYPILLNAKSRSLIAPPKKVLFGRKPNNVRPGAVAFFFQNLLGIISSPARKVSSFYLPDQ